MTRVTKLILGAGKSSRMNGVNKLFHKVGGYTVIECVHQSIKDLCQGDVHIMVNRQIQSQIQSIIPSAIAHVQHSDCSGTGGAVESFLRYNEKAQLGEFLLIVPGDCPLLSSDVVNKVIARAKENRIGACMYFYYEENGVHKPNSKYGKLHMDDNNIIRCQESEHSSRPCNSGVLAVSTELLRKYISQIPVQSNSETYLTNIFDILYRQNKPISGIEGKISHCLGVNDTYDLEHANKIMLTEKIKSIMSNGVCMYDSSTVIVSRDTLIEAGAIIHQNVVIGRGVHIMSGAEIMPFTHIEGVTIMKNAKIGPFTRIRPKSIICEGAKVGSFAEIKNSSIGRESAVPHSSYIGDTEIGNNVNIGAGTVVCNYDGKAKHKSVIKSDAFIGSNTSLISPVQIAGYVAAGTVITKDVPSGAIAIGRAEQVNKVKKQKVEKKTCVE